MTVIAVLVKKMNKSLEDVVFSIKLNLELLGQFLGNYSCKDSPLIGVESDTWKEFFY